MAALFAGAAAAPSAAAAPDPAAAASAYLQARGAAITAPDADAVLAPWLAQNPGLAASEGLMARGAADRAAQLGHRIDGVTTQVTVTASDVAASGDAATVTAHVITTLSWHAKSGAASTEGSGVDHTVVLRLDGETWRVATDAYTDDQAPAELEAAGAPGASVRAAARRLERASRGAALPAVAAQAGVTTAKVAQVNRYVDIIYYDRDAARDYADKYALSYNPTYTSFTADCANFASQCGRAGGMPMVSGAYESGWWYDKEGTSAPGNDTYSHSWINCARQMSFWNTRRTDWASSISDMARGDFVYYDWTGDGVWDHVAVFAGTNSAGQKVIDAHTTDYSHVFWKLGGASTKFKFAKTDATWMVN